MDQRRGADFPRQVWRSDESDTSETVPAAGVRRDERMMKWEEAKEERGEKKTRTVAAAAVDRVAMMDVLAV